MSMESLANLVSALHLGYFLFVVVGFIGIVTGACRGWTWIYNPWFRLIHLLAVLIILAEDVFRFPCVLNVLERQLRVASANAESTPSQLSGVFDLLLRHTIPGWLLDGMYWALGVVLLVLIVLLPPRFRADARLDLASR